MVTTVLFIKLCGFFVINILCSHPFPWLAYLISWDDKINYFCFNSWYVKLQSNAYQNHVYDRGEYYVNLEQLLIWKHPSKTIKILISCVSAISMKDVIVIRALHDTHLNLFTNDQLCLCLQVSHCFANAFYQHLFKINAHN